MCVVYVPFLQFVVYCSLRLVVAVCGMQVCIVVLVGTDCCSRLCVRVVVIVFGVVVYSSLVLWCVVVVLVYVSCWCLWFMVVVVWVQVCVRVRDCGCCCEFWCCWFVYV